jgi:hypothetical protein
MTLPRGFVNKKKVQGIEEQRKFETKMFFVFFVFYIVPFLPFILAQLKIYTLNSQQSFWLSSTVVLVGIGTIFAVYHCRKYYRKSVEDDLPKKRETTTGSLVVLAGIYAIVASFAITASLEGFFKALTSTNTTIRDPTQLISLLGSNYNYFTTTFLVLTFFSVAITSYLGTAFFLSYVGERPKEEIKSDLLTAGTKGLFFTFVLSFLHGTFLLFMAVSINSPESLSTPEIFSIFVLWLFLLELTDTIWIMVTMLVRTSGFKNPFQVPPPYEWVLLDTLMMIFLLAYFLYPTTITWDAYLALLIVFVARTLADFRVGWKSVYRPVILQK